MQLVLSRSPGDGAHLNLVRDIAAGLLLLLESLKVLGVLGE